MKLFRWFKEGKVNFEMSPPMKKEGEKFKGFRITLPSFFEWWFKPKEEKDEKGR